MGLGVGAADLGILRSEKTRTLTVGGREAVFVPATKLLAVDLGGGQLLGVRIEATGKGVRAKDLPALRVAIAQTAISRMTLGAITLHLPDLRGGQTGVKRGAARMFGKSNGRRGRATRPTAVLSMPPSRRSYSSDRGSRPAAISRTALASSRWSTPSTPLVATMPSPKSVASKTPATSAAGRSDRMRPSVCSASR